MISAQFLLAPGGVWHLDHVGRNHEGLVRPPFSLQGSEDWRVGPDSVLVSTLQLLWVARQPSLGSPPPSLPPQVPAFWSSGDLLPQDAGSWGREGSPRGQRPCVTSLSELCPERACTWQQPVIFRSLKPGSPLSCMMTRSPLGEPLCVLSELRCLSLTGGRWIVTTEPCRRDSAPCPISCLTVSWYVLRVSVRAGVGCGRWAGGRRQRQPPWQGRLVGLTSE